MEKSHAMMLSLFLMFAAVFAATGTGEEYNGTYNTGDIEEANVDIIAGIFAGFGNMSTVLGVAIVALVILGLLAAVIGKLAGLY